MAIGASESLLGPRGKVLRPGSAVGIGAFFGVVVALLLVNGLLSDSRSWPVLASCVLALVLAWLFIVHPHARLDRDGVTMVNPLSTAHVSWSAIDSVRSRWLLELVANGVTYSAWGVPADPSRPKYGRDLLRIGTPKHDKRQAEQAEAERQAKKVTAQGVGSEIEARAAEDRKKVRSERTPVIAVRAWDPLSIGLLVGALAFLAVALFAS